jgi:P-type Cu+ transporter
LEEEFTENKNADNVKEVTFKLEGMSCSCEAKIVEKRIKGLKGVKSYDINPISNRVKVSYDESLVSTDEIVKSISKTGMGASLVNVKR